MVDYNIAIPQQQLFQAPDLMQNAMRMQQMQTQDASAESANQLRAMQTRGLAQDQQLTALKMQAARQGMVDAAATRARAAGDQNALANAMKRDVVGLYGPQERDLDRIANTLDAEGRFNPAATVRAAINAATESGKKKADLDKTKEETFKITAENLDKEFVMFKTLVPTVRTPQDAGLWKAAMYDNERTGKVLRQMGLTREQVIAQAEQQFADDPKLWTATNLNITGQQAIGLLTNTQKQTDLGGQISTQEHDPFNRPVGDPTEQTKTMTPQQQAVFKTPEEELEQQRKLAVMQAEVAANAPPRAMTPQEENRQRAAVSKDRKAAITTIDAMGDMLDAVRGVRELSPGQKDSITGVRSYAFPLTKSSKTAETKLENLKGKVISLGKQIASVGGAIGSIATQEWQILSSQVASLKTEKMSGKDLDDQLDIIQGMANRLINRVRDSYTTQYEDLNAKYNGRFSLDYDRPSAGAGAGAGVNGVDTSNPLLR
tara:strand:- start:254 stop:1717 length:1464 start_codon:yes stop_codon:yes gene_type:complete